jgi:ribose 5-phosphate isomerase RpiB
VLTPEEGLRLADIWLETAFEAERHVRRLDKIRAIEERHFKPRA